MRLLFLGDIFGKPGRSAVRGLLPGLRDEFAPDVTIANAENIAGGAGMTPETCEDMLSLGINALTSGNHVWDRREVIPYLQSGAPIIRPANYPPGTPGCGWLVLERYDLLVVNLLGRVFMRSMDDPFRAADTILERNQRRFSILDFHAEATGEKKAMGFYLDGRVGAVVGTHTHVPTADAQVLPGGTAFITDVGMVGPAVSVIGNEPAPTVQRYVTQMPVQMHTAKGAAELGAVVIDFDDETGRALRIQSMRRRWPDTDGRHLADSGQNRDDRI